MASELHIINPLALPVPPELVAQASDTFGGQEQARQALGEMLLLDAGIAQVAGYDTATNSVPEFSLVMNHKILEYLQAPASAVERATRFAEYRDSLGIDDPRSKISTAGWLEMLNHQQSRVDFEVFKRSDRYVIDLTRQV